MKKIKLTSYWEPTFSQKYIKGNLLVEKISDELKNSLNMYTSDNKKYGLMLSGGLDSRAILSAYKEFEYLFTSGLSKNNEYEIAHKVSKFSASKHIFIKRELSHFDNLLDVATSVGGLHVYNEAQFLNFSDKIKINGGSIMIGLYLDILFGGLYLPKKHVNLFGKNLFHHKFLKVPKNNLNEFYLNNIKYRLKTSNPLSIIKDEFSKKLYDDLKSEVQNIMNKAKSFGAKILIFGNICTYTTSLVIILFP